MRCIGIIILTCHLFANGSAKSDQDLIDEYNDHSMGIAFTMRADFFWKLGESGASARRLAFLDDPTTYDQKAQKCISIVTSKQSMNTYAADGNFGLAFHITPDSQFWKHFQVKGHGKNAGNELCALPHDGYNCGFGASQRVPITKYGKSYSWFTARKMEILAKFNTFYKIHDYNEFDSNGYAASDLAGVFQKDSRRRKTPPSDHQMCKVLTTAFPERKTPWPVYGYQWYKLYIKRYLPCGGEGNRTAMIV